MRALPALTLESDSKKRPQPGPGGKVGGGGGGGGGKKKRKKGRPADNLPAFNPDEAYDPTKPNDIEAYLRWRTDQHRARERARKEREMRRQESATESSDGSYYSEDERDEAVKPSYKGASLVRRSALQPFWLISTRPSISSQEASHRQPRTTSTPRHFLQPRRRRPSSRPRRRSCRLT